MQFVVGCSCCHCPDDVGFVLCLFVFHGSAMSKRSVRAINSLALTQLLFHQTCSGKAGVPTDWLNDDNKQANQHTGHNTMGARWGGVEGCRRAGREAAAFIHTRTLTQTGAWGCTGTRWRRCSAVCTMWWCWRGEKEMEGEEMWEEKRKSIKAKFKLDIMRQMTWAQWTKENFCLNQKNIYG